MEQSEINEEFWKPNAIVLDTNLLVYLFQPEVISTETFNHFFSCVINGLKLIIPKQVKEEWDKHKVQRNEEYLLDATKAIERHKKLADHIPEEDEKNQFLTQIALLKKMAERKYRYSFGLRARNMDEIINDAYRTIIPDRNNNVESKVVEMSIKKMPPFFGSDANNKEESKKNEMADAVIFFTAYEYLKNHRTDYNKVFFISVNKTDFCVHGNPAKLHPNIESYANEVGMDFYNDLGRIIRIIDPDKRNLIQFHSEDVQQYLTDQFFLPCPECEEEVHINADQKLMPSRTNPHGTYHYTCPHCQYTWDTHETPEDYIY